jgi:predicted transcriptional regulator
MATLNMRLDDELERRLAREAEIADQTRSELARAAIAAFLEQRERERFLAEIARAARERGGREALAIAEEALPADNEALELAEGRPARQLKATYKVRRKRR